MENKHIELVKKWVADPESVTPEELKANSESAESADAAADAAYAAATDAAYAADAAARAAYAAAYAAAADSAVYWVKEYEELTGGE